MSTYDLQEINYRTVMDPRGLCDESQQMYMNHVNEVADMICENMKKSQAVLLSGPSSSGKTTTAYKITEALEKRGLMPRYVSMDDYYKSPDEDSPRNEDGTFDFESPKCLDWDLLYAQLEQLRKGNEIEIPHYDFATTTRSDKGTPFRLTPETVVIVEGIHALSDLVTSKLPDAFKLFIETKSDVMFYDHIVFDKKWTRLVRRTIRDGLFRSYDAFETLTAWSSVLRGEMNHIYTNSNKADYTFDTSFKCEYPLMASKFRKAVESCGKGDLYNIYPVLQELVSATLLFGEISDDFVASDSLLREFIG